MLARVFYQLPFLLPWPAESHSFSRRAPTVLAARTAGDQSGFGHEYGQFGIDIFLWKFFLTISKKMV